MASVAARLSQVAAWLSRIGPGGRALKTALAAGLAWEVGSRVPGAPTPYLAPLTAVLVTQITIADSIGAATQRFFGIVLGVGVALAVGGVAGLSGPSIALMVLLALMLGSAVHLGPQGIPQVAISALLIVAVGSAPTLELAYARVVETIIGAAIGIGINALLAPPSHLATARAAVAAHGDALAGVLDRLAAAIMVGITGDEADAILGEARATDGLLREAQAAVSRTEAALRFNLWQRHERPATERLALTLRTLERVAIQARGIVRTVDDAVAPEGRTPSTWIDPWALGSGLGAAITDIARLVRAFPAALAPGSGDHRPAFALLVDEAARSRCLVAGAGEAQDIRRESDGWIELGSVLADLDRIRRELAEVVAAPPLDGAPLPPLAPGS
ncbi:MAG: hypothetical protein AVDCRST_MAG59-919 [uncultured Thermomicrobiales bacterium]|uniref:Integral membrane bound transporter domain-containing protein n=1 Tax=uncultured Thermomicrobiales bacterium TaxID=1645740 RepID=A0A6J4U930_9BACT|nr:MAG: hypothetical protein AVDCRST_MAG59-919 [uncultured Thermomicrobiales bacterium]